MNFAAQFCPFLMEIQKVFEFFSLLTFFLVLTLQHHGVYAEWTNMCLNLVMQKIKIMNLFCLPEYSILIGHYETTGLRSIFTLLSPMWTIHFTLVLIQFICVACLLVCKYTNQKKVDLCTNSDWSLTFDIFWQKILHSDWSIWCNLFSEPDETLLHLSADFWSNNFA